MKKIVLFASGNGSNAENIINYFKANNKAHVVEIFTNNPDAGVIRRAKKSGVPLHLFNRESFYHTSAVLDRLKEINPDLIVLAGFLWKVPQEMIRSFHHKIINIHPALLPKFGGKGMYGMKVHKAVIQSGEKTSGITIHWVNEEYDKGAIIAQFTYTLSDNETADSLAQNIHKLEYTYFPVVINNILKNQ